MAQTGRSRKSVANQDYFDHVMALLALGQKVKLPVKGNSMLPFLEEGDTVLLQANNGEAKRGRIVLASYKSAFVLHRVIHCRAEWLELAGDNNLVLRERVAQGDLIAEVLEAYRDEENLNIYSPAKMLGARIWHCLRPARRVMGKLLKMTKAK